MSWRTDLWDQLDRLIDLAHRNIEFCERYNDFMKERCKSEQAYAKELRKLAKNYQPKKKEEEEEKSSCLIGYCGVLKELGDMAGQHETIAENLQGNVMKPLQALIAELKTERKKCQEDGKKLLAQLDNHLQLLLKAKRRYELAFRESEKAHELYVRNEADPQLSRADVERSRSLAAQRTQFCTDAKAEYASVLQATNDYQRQHYGELLPRLVEQMQRLEEKRVNQFKSMVKDSSRVENDVHPIIAMCISGIDKAAEQINVTADVQQVIVKLKTGHVPPGDVPFEDLGPDDGSGGVSHGSSTGNLRNSSGDVGTGTTPKKSEIGSTRAKTAKDRGGLRGIFGKPKTEEAREDFGHLPPQQQKNQLSKKIAEFNAQFAKETKEREAMAKMVSLYTQNPSLGDPKVVEKQMEDKSANIDTITAELRKYEQYLAQADGSAINPDGTRSPYGERKAEPPSKPPLQSLPSDKSLKSPSTGDTGSAPIYDSFDEDDNDSSPTADGGVCTATALYPFQPTTDGSVALDSDEVVTVLERDQGDGWTNVSRANGQKGFVPTAYIQLSN